MSKETYEVTKLSHIITSALAILETRVSKVLGDGEIVEWEFQVLQTLHFRVIDKLSDVDCKMESEAKTQLQKSLLEEINEIKKTLRTRDAS